jgi:phosphate starvation-inducible protein PhoH
MVPIKAQLSYHLLFSSNTEYGPIVPQIQKAGRYYFSHDKKNNLLCGTDKKHLSILEKDYTVEILSNGQNAYYIRQTPEKYEINYFSWLK